METKTDALLSPERLSLPGVETIVFTESCESTQDAAKCLAGMGQPEGTVVISLCQTAGRGRLDRKWHSPKGGIYMSVLLRPLARPEDYPGLTLKIADCISGACKKLYGVKTRIKPPNDVYACDAKGRWRKLAGILTEACTLDSSDHWVVAGIGVNLADNLPQGLSNTAVSLEALSGVRPDAARFLFQFFSLFQPEYAAWQTSAASRLK